MFKGEIISLIVAVSWTATALFAERATNRLGSVVANVLRLAMASIVLALLLWLTIGSPYPIYADGRTWLWLALSAVIGYVFGDWCLFNSYKHISARFGQLFMTLAPPTAAISSWMILGESLSWKAALAMVVTLSGIAISILSKGSGHSVRFSLPLKGILLGIGAGIGQGVGLVFSKVGIQYYAEALPSDSPAIMADMLPFASTMIRAIVGVLGFFLLMVLRNGVKPLEDAFHDREGMKFAVLTTLFGPVLGVSLSLMAVQYTNAGIASTLMALTPVLILIPYAFIYKQKIKAKEILGVTLSMLGVALFFLL